MTQTETHRIAQQTAGTAAILDRARMKPSRRRALETAEAAGDWATVAEMTGQDVGTN